MEQNALEQQLEDANIIFFGGHPNWMTKVHQYFPKSTVVDVDKINKSKKFNIMNSADFVCINTDYFNHGFI